MSITEIRVTHPDFTGWIQRPEIFAEVVFGAEEFTIDFVHDGKGYQFQDSLPEFLAAYTKFLKSDKKEMNFTLLISGSNFEFKRLDDSISFEIYDSIKNRTENIVLNETDTGIFHRELLSSLAEILRKTFSRNVTVKDMDSFLL